MIEHLEERRRFLELYSPWGNYKEHEVEEIKAIEKKLAIEANFGDWVRTPDGDVLICAITDLPIMDSDNYHVVLCDVVIDEPKSLPRKE